MFIKSIKQERDLQNTFNFLRCNMKWSKLKAYNLYKKIKNTNKEIGYYGYTLQNSSNKISGAILIFDQGDIENNGNKLRIINISTWFVESEFRGYQALLMIQKLIKDHEDIIITDLTPTYPVYKILKSFGFKDLETHNKKFNFISIIFNKKILSCMSFLFFAEHPTFISEKKSNFLKSNSNLIIFYLNDKEKLEVSFSQTKWEKKIGKNYISFNGLRILWTSDKKLFNKNLYKVLLLLTLKFKTFFITTHCQIKSAKKKKKNQSNHLYRINPKYKIDSAKISALGSELEYL